MKRIAFAAMALAAAFALAACGSLVRDKVQPTGTVTGIVNDSSGTGLVLAGVRVTIVGGSQVATTDSLGSFSIIAPVGSVTLHFALAGYMFVDQSVTVLEGETVSANDSVVAYPTLAAGQYRMVLTWGALPYDLDSHLWLPISEDVYFGHQVASDGSANLDWDDTSSYGPETVTISTVKPGTYSYSIHNYSGSPAMGPSSQAVVGVYDSTGLIKTVRLADAPGSAGSADLWWDVLTISGSGGSGSLITYNNQLVGSQPGAF